MTIAFLALGIRDLGRLGLLCLSNHFSVQNICSFLHIFRVNRDFELIFEVVRKVHRCICAGPPQARLALLVVFQVVFVVVSHLEVIQKPIVTFTVEASAELYVTVDRPAHKYAHQPEIEECWPLRHFLRVETMTIIFGSLLASRR